MKKPSACDKRAADDAEGADTVVENHVALDSAAMASHVLSQFPQDEQDDFAEVCKKRGRAVAEFEVVDEDQYPSGGRVGPIGGK